MNTCPPPKKKKPTNFKKKRKTRSQQNTKTSPKTAVQAKPKPNQNPKTKDDEPYLDDPHADALGRTGLKHEGVYRVRLDASGSMHLTPGGRQAGKEEGRGKYRSSKDGNLLAHPPTYYSSIKQTP